MFDRIFCTDESSWHIVPLRAALGLACALHGVNSLVVFGLSGPGSAVFALGLMTLFGFLTRPAAALILLGALGGLARSPGSPAGFLNEIERLAALFGGAAALLFTGSGRLSVDSMIQERLIRCHFSDARL